jgi:hypothetical protein
VDVRGREAARLRAVRARTCCRFLYLTIFGSIVAFAAYLTLLKRIGAARSGYIGVMVPIVALVISAASSRFAGTRSRGRHRDIGRGKHRDPAGEK